MSAVAAVKEMQGFIFIGANQPFEHPHISHGDRGALFASDRSYYDDDDDVPSDDFDAFDRDNRTVQHFTA